MKRSDLYEGMTVYRRIKNGKKIVADGPWTVAQTTPYCTDSQGSIGKSSTGNGVLLHQNHQNYIVSGLGWLLEESEGLALIQRNEQEQAEEWARVERENIQCLTHSSYFQGCGFKDASVQIEGDRVVLDVSVYEALLDQWTRTFTKQPVGN